MKRGVEIAARALALVGLLTLASSCRRESLVEPLVYDAMIGQWTGMITPAGGSPHVSRLFEVQITAQHELSLRIDGAPVSATMIGLAPAAVEFAAQYGAALRFRGTLEEPGLLVGTAAGPQGAVVHRWQAVQELVRRP